MHSEEEARKKWCPFARVAGVVDGTSTQGSVSFNRRAPFPQKQGEITNCIARDCMAWRFSAVRIVPIPGTGNTRTVSLGYCGLATEPQRTKP